jgi:hypothetical protein
MPALVAGIHVFCDLQIKTWMAGTSPAMTPSYRPLGASCVAHLILTVAEKLHSTAIRSVRPIAPQLSPRFSRTTRRGLRRRHKARGDAMRDTLDKGIPDTAPYKEWLGIVGSMMAAVLICVVLFSAGFLT